MPDFKSIKHQYGRVVSVFVETILGAGFLSSNAYYFHTLNTINNLTAIDSTRPPLVREIAFKTPPVSNEDIEDIKPTQVTPVDIEINDALSVCEFWREEAKEHNNWEKMIIANEACINAMILVLKKNQ